MLSIRIYGDPVLRRKGARVAVFDDALREFVGEMVETMRNSDGVGLAAPQVGRSIQCAVVEPSKEEGAPLYVLVNPEFTYTSGETADHEEGCLSFPDLDLNISRPKVVSIKAFDEYGREFSIEKAEGLLSRALQHEIDHLDGLLIIDHVSLLQRKLLKGKLKKISEMHHGEQDMPDTSASGN